ncbi:HAD family hydrolase [Paenibacillus sp. IITD108]|uniref:HAD family hydrolase n=1 Tax=Paenibacillus sp. IITD108 TaxID=3116649 RepID=UPI002F404ECE
MKVIVFDMDDTLYDELTYVKSGFRATAAYLNERYGIPQEDAFTHMNNTLQFEGRGAVFNKVLQAYGLENRSRVIDCIKQYRHHKPQIELYPDAVAVLTQLSSYPVYIVTDGHKEAQHRKLEALGLYSRVKKCYITHRYGKHHAKPSPYCFQQIAKRENMAAAEIVYIGDNVNKDFVGIKPLGFRTVQIMRGSYVHAVRPESYQADSKINSLIEIIDML